MGQGDGAEAHVRVSGAGDHDAHGIGVVLPDGGEEGHPIEPRHVQVRHDQVGAVGLHLHEGGDTTLGAIHTPLGACPGQDTLESPEDEGLVVHHQDLHAAPSFCWTAFRCAASRGMDTTKVTPLSGFDRKPSAPPWPTSTISRAMESP